MSTITASNISDGTDTVGTEYVVNGSAKSWASFNGTGTPSIINSLNVSSLNDDGTGRYGVVYTNTFSSGDNFVSATNNAGSDTYSAFRTFSTARSNETGKINSQYLGDGGAAVDPSRVYVGVWGDLA